jgi:transcriptional accessory protein Tex/SPT6
MEMSEQELVQAPEVSAPAQEQTPIVTMETTTTTATADAASDGGPVVKLLSVGQALQGTVKRITEFGAFVDIGVGRDGLVHISELSTTRVAKVSDLLKEGQAVTLWIKKLDRDRNRISLTMIEPGKRTIRDLQVGEVVEGSVTRILPYGAFIDIGVGRDALLHVREMAEGFVAKPEDVVKSGDTVEVRIIEIARRRNRIDVSMKGLRPEPEPVQRQVEEAPTPELTAEEAEYEDRFANIEALTTMQVAFLKAQERSGVVLPIGKSKKPKHSQARNKRAAQDDILTRTLNTQGNKK